MQKYFIYLYLSLTSFHFCFGQGKLVGIIDQQENATQRPSFFAREKGYTYSLYSSGEFSNRKFTLQKFDKNLKLIKEVPLDIDVHQARILRTNIIDNKFYILFEEIRAKDESRHFLSVTVDLEASKVVDSKIVYSPTETKGLTYSGINTDDAGRQTVVVNKKKAYPYSKVFESKKMLLVVNTFNKGKIINGVLKLECLVLDKKYNKQWAKLISLPYKASTDAKIKDIVIGEKGEILITIDVKKNAYLHYYNAQGDSKGIVDINSLSDKIYHYRRNYKAAIKLDGNVVLATFVRDYTKNNYLHYFILDKNELKIISSKEEEIPVKELLKNYDEKEAEKERKRMEKGKDVLVDNFVRIKDIIVKQENFYIVGEVCYKYKDQLSSYKDILIYNVDRLNKLRKTSIIRKNQRYNGAGGEECSYSLFYDEKKIYFIYNDVIINKDDNNQMATLFRINDKESCVMLASLTDEGEVSKKVIVPTVELGIKMIKYYLFNNSEQEISSNSAIFRLDKVLEPKDKFFIVNFD